MRWQGAHYSSAISILKMRNVKTVLYAGGLAFAVNNFCVLLLLGLGSIDQWFFVKPLMKYALNIEPILLGIAIIYLIGFFQYFIIFWAILKIIFRFRKKTPPIIK